MAICPKCKDKISDAATVCPHCNCNIEEFYNNIKKEKERLAKEKAEKARLAAEEQRKAEELADRLICPDCKEKVTLEDKTCPKCGFPLDDKGERERAKLWNDIKQQNIKPGFKERWLVPLVFGYFVCMFVFYIIIKLSDRLDDFLRLLPIPIVLGIAVTAFSVIPSFLKAADAKEKNFEKFMIENENMGAIMFADLVKHGMAHCPFCKRRLTEKSLIYGKGSTPQLKVICCEHCGRLIDFPGDRMREQMRQAEIKRNWRRRRWGL